MYRLTDTTLNMVRSEAVARLLIQSWNFHSCGHHNGNFIYPHYVQTEISETDISKSRQIFYYLGGQTLQWQNSVPLIYSAEMCDWVRWTNANSFVNCYTVYTMAAIPLISGCVLWALFFQMNEQYCFMAVLDLYMVYGLIGWSTLLGI